MSKAHILIEDYAGVTVVTFMDTSILDSVVIDGIAKELYHLTDRMNKQKLILDFSNVRFLSSQTLGVLLTLNSKIQAIGGTLAVCALRAELTKIFKISKLDKLFKFYRDDSAALASFGVHVG